MIRVLSASILMVASALAPAADEVEQLDADFLEYLAHMEGDDDDWTLVAQAEEAEAQARKAAEAAKTAKPAKQADRPAVDER